MPKVPAHAPHPCRENQQHTDAAAQTYKQGAAVFLDSGNSYKVTECGAAPALIYGFSNGPAGLHPEGATTTIISKMGNGQKMWMSCSSDPTAANQNIAYGIAKDGDGIWVVDLTDVVNTRVYVHQVDVSTKQALVSVLQANRQIEP